jgi:putative acetyltransferase
VPRVRVLSNCTGTEHLTPPIRWGNAGTASADSVARGLRLKNSTIGEVEPRIRAASVEDARAILEVHYSAVHDTAVSDYAEDVLTEWSPPITEDRIEKYALESLSRHTTLVAEMDGLIAGYGVIEDSCNVLRDLYVSSRCCRRGIGSALLRAFEDLARERGCKELRMNATLTAHRFYLRHGYEELSRDECDVGASHKLAYIRMRKAL